MSPCLSRSLGAAAALGALVASNAVLAADLPTDKGPAPAPAPVPPPAIDYFQPFFVKLGFTYALNTSFSKIWAQNPIAMAQGDFAAFPLGVGATIGNVPTLGVEAGVFVTRNISLNVSSGIPEYVDVKTKGYNPENAVLTNGTVLAQIMPAFVPITAVYHFDNFGAFRPYVGAGIAPGFSLANKNGFTTGVHVGSSVGPVIQAGFDYMMTPSWGMSVDVKKTFAYSQSNQDGLNIPGVGAFPANSYLHTHFQPWTFSAGLVYAFGKSGILPTF